MIAEPEATPSEDTKELATFAPHEEIHLNGVLCCGQSIPRQRKGITEIALRSLINLVRQVTDWTDPSGHADAYAGNYRFLVLDARMPAGTDTFVQIWSEPFDELIVEVGPGNRDDAALQSFADRIRESLYDRGFEIGGNADNFKKTLSKPCQEDAPRVARELLAILMDVLGYDGRTDLGYRFTQDSHLQSGQVVSSFSRDSLQTMCTVWGIRSRLVADEDNLLEAHDLYQGFQLHLYEPQSHRPGSYWEIHCVILLDLDHDKALALVAKVNDRPYLLKAFATSGSTDLTQLVRLSFGINLAGGVTLDHVRCQIKEFLALVRRLRWEM